MYTYTARFGAAEIEGDYFLQYDREGESWECTVYRAGFSCVMEIGEENGYLQMGLYFWASADPESREQPEYKAFVNVCYGGAEDAIYLMPTTHDALAFLREFAPLIQTFNAVERDLQKKQKREQKEARGHGR